MPSIWIVFGIVFWEVLLGNVAYVNTFYKMSKVVPPGKRKFVLDVVNIGGSNSIALVGVLSIPAHNVFFVPTASSEVIQIKRRR